MQNQLLIPKGKKKRKDPEIRLVLFEVHMLSGVGSKHTDAHHGYPQAGMMSSPEQSGNG